MKRIFCFLMVGVLCLMAKAIPADPTPIQVTQPDGTTVTVALHGDEFFHFTTTLDGYTVVKNAQGFYTYAMLVAITSCRAAVSPATLRSVPREIAPS